MSKTQICESSRWPWLAVAALWAVAATLAVALTRAERETGAAAATVAERLLVGSQSALSGGFMERADLYFHRGADHVVDRGSGQDLFERYAQELSPAGHAHRHGHDIGEIMPWLRMAVRANPRNVEAYRVAAYWLAGEAERPDLAIEVLAEAERENPDDYRILLAQGRLYLQQERLGDAARALDRAWTEWPSGQDPSDEEARLEKAQILLFQALLRQIEGDRDGALAAFHGILDLFPERDSVRERMTALEGSEDPKALALRMLDVLLRHHESVCRAETPDPAGLGQVE